METLDFTEFHTGGGGQNKSAQRSGKSWALALNTNSKKTHGFTLAEVLITLGIIGMVAALTLPDLVSKNDERVRYTQLKKAYSTLAQAHQIMIVQDIYPYREYVEPFKDLAQAETPTDESNPEDGTQGTIPDEPKDSGEDSGSVEDSEKPSVPDIKDSTTKALVDDLVGALRHLDFKTASENFDKLVGKYGYTNLGPFIIDYAADSGVSLPNFIINILGGNKYKSYINNELYKVPYLHIFAVISETTPDNEELANFIQVKQSQLKVLKNILKGAQYCSSYDKCTGAEPIQYTTLDGNIASIEAAEFENSALKTADGMHLWLGDINNPQRYYIDINGSKRPNKLGVDLFTFDIIKKETISPEKNENCTRFGLTRDGLEYKGLGCSGYALIDTNPDKNQKGYWKHFK